GRSGPVPWPRGRTVQQPGTGSQRYSSSVRPSIRGRKWLSQCQASCSVSSCVQSTRSPRVDCPVGVPAGGVSAGVFMPPVSNLFRTAPVRYLWDAGGMDDTLARVLGLLNLLQSRPVWTGTELAAELGVTTRSIRRDVDRLRGLGYPIRATQGVGGGYQLGAGKALPPLLLDDGEAVA